MAAKKGNTNGKKTWFKKGHTFWKGQKHTEESKQRMSLVRIGKTYSDETKKKMSDAAKRKKRSAPQIFLEKLLTDNPSKKQEVKEKISKAHKGKHWSPQTEFKKGHVGYNKNGFITEEQKLKISMALMGHKVSKEARSKLKDARKKQKIPTHHTTPEIIFENICKKNKLPYKYTGDGTFWIGNINPDFINCSGKKIAIEIFGDYWHSPLLNPKLTERSTATYRKKALKKYGWKLMILWESDLIRTDAEAFVLSELKNKQY